MSDLLQKHPAASAIAAAVALAVAAVIIVRSLRSAAVAAPSQSYFYSLQSGELFPAAYDSIPPVPAPAGGEAVRAYVYSCAACDDANRFIAYLETYPAEAQAKLRTAKAAGDYDEAGRIMAEHRLVAPPPPKGKDAAEPPWLDAASPQAEHLLTAHRARCGDAAPIPCDP